MATPILKDEFIAFEECMSTAVREVLIAAHEDSIDSWVGRAARVASMPPSDIRDEVDRRVAVAREAISQAA
jgi:predicted HTH domain antitoxin